MPGEVDRRLEPRLAREQARTADRLDPLAEQAAPARLGRRMVIGMDTGVDVLAAEVCRLMRRRDLHVEVAVQCMELREARHQPADRERRRNLEPKRLIVGLLLQLTRRVFELVERPANDSRVHHPFRRQPDTAAVAYEELHAKPCLER